MEINPNITPKEALGKLNLIKKDKLTNGAILLFGKNSQKFFLQSEVRCTRFKGIEPLEFIDMKVFDGNIIDQREDALEFVKEHIQLHAEIKGTERIERWGYPIKAIEHIKKIGKITNKSYREMFPEIFDETARLDLNTMVRKMLLNKRGEKRGGSITF